MATANYKAENSSNTGYPNILGSFSCYSAPGPDIVHQSVKTLKTDTFSTLRPDSCNIPVAVLALGLSLILITDKGFGLSAALVFIASLLMLRPAQFTALNRLDRLFISLLCILPLLVLLNLLYHNLFSWPEFDIPSRFLLFIPIYVLFRSREISLDLLVVGAALGCFITAIYSIYQFLESPGIRVTLHDNPITFGQIAFVLAAIALIPNSQFFNTVARARLFVTLLTFLGLICLAANQSRGVFLVTPLLFLYLFRYRGLLSLNRYTAVLIIALAGVALFAIGSNPLFLYLSHLSHEITANLSQLDTSSSLGIRLTLWINSLELISQNWITGYGVGQFGPALASLAEKNHIAPGILLFSHAHNDLLNLGVELGIFGPVAAILVFLVPYYMGVREQFSLQSRYLLILVFLTWLLFGLSQTQLAHQKITMLQILLLCIGFAHGMNEKFGSTQSRES